MAALMIIYLLSIWGTINFSVTSAARRSYTAAAYEHARFGKEWDPPKLVVETNLEMYVRAGEIASSKGADIIVYPEYGLYYPGNRTQLKSYLEETPDPKKVHANPCNEGKAYSQRPILRTLSCIAKNNSIVVVANFGSIENCSGEEDCPEDGVFHFNTNVVFDRDGMLLLRYYKEHLFFELGMDLAREQQDPTFKTDFGTFVTFICFDLIFSRASQVAKWPHVDGVMFSAMWYDSGPQYIALPLWQGWAMGNNATLVAANIQIPGYSAVGSGIFNGLQGHLGYTFNPDGISKLVLAKVPISKEPFSPAKPNVIAFTKTKTWSLEDDGKDVPEVCSRTLLNDTDDLMGSYRCVDEKTTNHTLVKLVKSNGFIEACNNGMCCSVQYSAETMKEEYYLGVYNGTRNSLNRYYNICEEDCFIARCDAIEGRRCSIFPRKSNTVFHRIELRSKFTTPYIYPSVTSNKVRLVPLTEWEFKITKKGSYESSITFHSKVGRKIITAGFKGRCYERDPPYIR